MFFHKKRVEAYDNARDRDRPAIPDAEDIVVEVDIEDGMTPPIPGDLHDLHVGGTGVSIPAELDPGILEGDVVRLTIAHPVHGWTVTTPACVEYKLPEGGTQYRFGFEFVNMGNLYAQLDNAIVRYFNRRRGARIFTSLDESFDAKLRVDGHPMQGRVHDISRVGLSIVLDKSRAERCTPGQAIELEFKLPDDGKTIKGQATVSQHRDLGEHAFLGIDFDIEDKRGFAKHQDRLARYVLERRHLTEKYEDALERGTIPPLPMEPSDEAPAEEARKDKDQDQDKFGDRDAA